MKFNIKFGNQYLAIEADNAVQAIIKLVDSGLDVANITEFNILPDPIKIVNKAA